MFVSSFPVRMRLAALLAGLGVAGLAAPSLAAPLVPPVQVVVPQEDRFAPFAITIRAGQSVEWINRDTDDHTVVSDDVFNTAGNKGTDQLLPGTDSNGGKPGRFVLRFNRSGTFIYYCRFHARLDSANQPVAPGPCGGIQDANRNFGTPMMGVVTVLGERDN
jgi:plastocyanin